MRRSVIATIGAAGLFTALMILALGPGAAHGSLLAQTAAPYSTALIDLVEIVDATPQPQNLVLARVTLPPGGSIPTSTAHTSPSILYVQTGVICLTLPFPEDEVWVVTPSSATPAAVPANPVAANCGQPDPDPSCMQSPGCQINGPNKSILLRAGDSASTRLESDQSIHRWYANAGSDGAIVLISDVQIGDEGLPCGGACP